MRNSRRAPLVEVGDGVTQCCTGILSVVPAELGLNQRIPFGTTAWRTSMGRRQVVESVNAALKGAYVDLARGFFRVFGQAKMTVLLGFTVAAYNLDRVRSFRAKQALGGPGRSAPARTDQAQRAKRRTGIWSQLVEQRSQAPPAG